MNNWQYYFFKVKKYQRHILTLGLLYGAAIVFPDFGPVLLRAVEKEHAIFMGIFSMFFLAFSIYPKIGLLPKIELHKKYLPTVGILSLVLASVFALVPSTLQFLFLAVFAFTIGRMTVFWSKDFVNEVPPRSRGEVIGTSLFISYGILYLSNAIVPSLPRFLVPSIAGILLFCSTWAYYSFSKNVSEYAKKSPPYPTSSSPPFKLYVLFLCIYITAGFTYVGVYARFSSYVVERFYNVLPFVFSAIIAGIIADRKGRKYLLYIGIALLGLSFTFYSFSLNILTYFLIQTTLQSGWAFLDVFVWVIVADIAVEKKSFYYYTYGIATMVAGVALGALLSAVVRQFDSIQNLPIGLMGYLPLFAAVALLGLIPETLHRESDSSEPIEIEDFDLPIIEKLTPREKEIVALLYKKLSNKEICELLCISNNTLKTHLRNIYRKTGTANRKELRNLLVEFLK